VIIFYQLISRQQVSFLQLLFECYQCDAIDDVLDAIEETAAMFEMYSIEYTDEYMAEFVDNIQNKTSSIASHNDKISSRSIGVINV
jgi:hypothetical protein